MSAANEEVTPQATEGSAVTIQSPDRKKVALTPKASTSIGHVRTEHPVDPPNPTKAFAPPAEEFAPGNPSAILSLKLEGQLGIFYNRGVTTRLPELIDINIDNIRDSANRVLTFVLTELAQKQKEFDSNTLVQTVNDISSHLSNGISVMIYMKLHSLNVNDERVADRYRIKPKVPEPFEVPTPYALAITQLGAIKISSMVEERYFAPTMPIGRDNDFGCSVNVRWSPIVYSRYVVLAKKLGLNFSVPTLDVKMGSSWWLYRPVNEGNAFRLDCPFPEENFTLNTTVLACLFCNNEADGFNNPIIDEGVLGNATYCSMARRLPLDYSVNCYYAISEEKEVIYMVAH